MHAAKSKSCSIIGSRRPNLRLTRVEIRVVGVFSGFDCDISSVTSCDHRHRVGGQDGHDRGRSATEEGGRGGDEGRGADLNGVSEAVQAVGKIPRRHGELGIPGRRQRRYVGQSYQWYPGPFVDQIRRPGLGVGHRHGTVEFRDADDLQPFRTATEPRRVELGRPVVDVDARQSAVESRHHDGRVGRRIGQRIVRGHRGNVGLRGWVHLRHGKRIVERSGQRERRYQRAVGGVVTVDSFRPVTEVYHDASAGADVGERSREGPVGARRTRGGADRQNAAGHGPVDLDGQLVRLRTERIRSGYLNCVLAVLFS